MKKLWCLAVVLCSLLGCESAYYGAWEKVGVHKRDILVDRIEDTRSAQEEALDQFKDALEQYRAVVNFDGGELETHYNLLNREYQDSEQAAMAIAERIDDVEDVAEDLFDEWEKELGLIENRSLREDSARKLHDTRYKYQHMLKAMRRAEKSVQPVLSAMRDQVLYLKHNLNARAIASLRGELNTINADVNRLILDMQKSIDESNLFIDRLRQ